MTKGLTLVLAGMLAWSPLSAHPLKVGPIPELKYTPPVPEKVILPNGGTAYLLEDHSLPVFSMRIYMRSTPAYEPRDKVGMFGLFGETWRSGGTKSKTPAELNDTLEFTASKLNTGADDETVNIEMWCLSKNFDATYALFQELLFQPRFDATQVDFAKSKGYESLRRKNDDPANIGRRAFRDIIFGPKHIYARNPTEETIKKITIGDLARLHKQVAVPDGAVVAVSGDFNKTEMIGRLNELFGKWAPRGASLPAYDYEAVSPMDGKIFLVEKDINQSRVTIGRRGVARHSPDHFPLIVADDILGGNSGTSRLFSEIRSRRGLAYSVGSFLLETKGTGLLGVGGQTKAGTTAAMIQALFAEVDKFTAAAPTDQEVKLSKDSMINSFVFQFNSPAQIVSQAASLDFYGFPGDYMDRYLENLAKVKKEDVLNVAKKYYGWETMKVLVVGNRSLFDEEFKSLGELVVIPIEKID